MNRSLAIHFVLAGVLFLPIGRALGAPAAHQHRIPQTIIVNGQQAEGVTVTQDGVTLPFYCPNPQPYTTVDQSSSGWACFNDGSWTLNAMPPAFATSNAIPPACAASNAAPPACTTSDATPPACTSSDATPPACAVRTKPRHDHAPPYDYYIYAYPDYTYYPEGFFGGGTGHGHGGPDGGHHK